MIQNSETNVIYATATLLFLRVYTLKFASLPDQGFVSNVIPCGDSWSYRVIAQNEFFCCFFFLEKFHIRSGECKHTSTHRHFNHNIKFIRLSQLEKKSNNEWHIDRKKRIINNKRKPHKPNSAMKTAKHFSPHTTQKEM